MGGSSSSEFIRKHTTEINHTNEVNNKEHHATETHKTKVGYIRKSEGHEYRDGIVDMRGSINKGKMTFQGGALLNLNSLDANNPKD